WEDCLARFGHHSFLFGDFSIADAFYAPVVCRFKTYGVALAPALQAYCGRVLAHPAVARWVDAAMREDDPAPQPDLARPQEGGWATACAATWSAAPRAHSSW